MPRKKRSRKSGRKFEVPKEIQPFHDEAIKHGLTPITVQVLLQNGYNSIPTISTIEECDLKELQIPLAQKSVLRRFVKSLSPDLTTPQGRDFLSVNTIETGVECVHAESEILDASELPLSQKENEESQTAISAPYKGKTTESSMQKPVFRPQIQIVSSDDDNDSCEITGIPTVDNTRHKQKEIVSVGNIDSDYRNRSEEKDESESGSAGTISSRECEVNSDTSDDCLIEHVSGYTQTDTPTTICANQTRIVKANQYRSTKNIRRSDIKLLRKEQRVNTKNTYVEGASGCIIGENIQITKNEMRDNVDHKMKTIEEQSLMILEHYKKEDELFTVTEAFKLIKEELESVHFITITGRPGDGKTTIAMHLLLEYSKDNRRPTIVQSTDMWDTVCSLKEKQVLLIDDIFGVYVYDDAKAKPWISRFEIIEKIIKQANGKLYVIFTSRSYIVKEVKPYLDKFDMFKSQHIIDLSHKDFKMSLTEKTELLERHLQFHNYQLDEKTIEEIALADPPHGFPHCVRLFTTSFFLYRRGLKFFENPLESLNAEIERFRCFDKNKYCILVLMAMHDGVITSAFLNDVKPKTDKVCSLIRVCGLPDSTPLSVLKDALLQLISVYVRITIQGSYSFNHETISEAVCYSVSKCNPEVAIESMDLKFLNKRIKTQSWMQNNDVLVIRIPRDTYSCLWKRLHTEIRNGVVKQSIKHQAWEDSEFVANWSEFASGEVEEKDKKTTEKAFFLNLLEQEDKSFRRTPFYWAVFHKKQPLIELMFSYIDVVADSTLINTQMSLSFVTACFTEMSTRLLQKMILNGASLEYIDSANEFTHTLKTNYGCNLSGADSDYGDIREWLEYAFGEELGRVFLKGGATALQAAAYSGNMEVIKFLFESGCKIHTRQYHDRTVFHFASVKNRCDVQTYLVDNLALKLDEKIPIQDAQLNNLINTRDRKGRTALHFAESEEMMNILLSHRSKVNMKDIYGNTPLLYRAKYGLTPSMIELLCKNRNGLVNARDKTGKNALHIALRYDMDVKNLTKCILKFSELGLDFNCRTYKAGTPLMSAIKKYAYTKERNILDTSKIIQLLAECGADMDAVDYFGKTALHHSIDSANVFKSEILLLNGANPVVSSYIRCPIIYSCTECIFRHISQLTYSSCGVICHFKTLIKHVANINVTDENNKTLLHLLLENDVVEIHDNIKFLIERGIDVNAKDNNGTTAVMLASSISYDVLNLIINHGGIVGELDKTGRNALFYVSGKDLPHVNVIDCLLEHGISINHPDVEQKTPIQVLLANTHCNINSVDYFISKGAYASHVDLSGRGVFHHLLSRKHDKYSNRGKIHTDCTYSICEMLVSRGFDINALDVEGNTPFMHLCVMAESSDVLLKLSSNENVNISVKNKFGRNAIHLMLHSKTLCQKDITDVIDVLEERNFDFNACDSFSKTPLVCAMENNLNETVERLLRITDIFDTLETKMQICQCLLHSNIVNTLLQDKSRDVDSSNNEYPGAHDIERRPKVPFLDSDTRYYLLKKRFITGDSVFFSDGTVLPHFLIKSYLLDDTVEHLFSVILRNRAALTVTDEKGRTALHVAIQYSTGSFKRRRINIINQLLAHGANPNHRDAGGRTTLHYCVQSDRTDKETERIMESLLEKGGDPFLTNCNGKDILKVLSKEQSRLGVIKSVRKRFILPYEGKTLLKLSQIATYSFSRQFESPGINDMVDLIIQGLEYDFLSKNKTKALHIACRFCSLDTVKVYLLGLLPTWMILMNEINIKDDDGRTPLHLLINAEIIRRKRQQIEQIESLLLYYERSSYGFFDKRIFNRGLELLHFLLKRDADPNITDEKGNSPLHMLLTSDWRGQCLYMAIELLIKYGANVDAKNDEGTTPLMLAAGCGILESRAVLVRILLGKGASINAVDNNNKDVIWYTHKSLLTYAKTIFMTELSFRPHADILIRMFEGSMPSTVHLDD